MSSRFPLVAFVLTVVSAFTVPVYSQEPEDLQKAPDNCSGPLGPLIPECQAAKPNVVVVPSARTGNSDIPSLANAPSTLKESPAALPPVVVGADTPSEFQRFAASSVGSILPVFGASLFERVPSTFAPLEHVPVTADYVIGPGDEIVLRVWGQVDLNLELMVDRAGAVYIPQAGNITVSGLQFKQLPEFLKSELRRVFRNFDLNVSMGQLRSIQVLVIGQARRPGTYTVSSLSTLVNLLFASGGPTARGSMRHIQLKRNDVVVSEIDLYDLLMKGDKSRDKRLLPGDVVFIPTVGPEIAISGSIREGAIFELKDERTVDEILPLAGGLTAIADGKHIVIERINTRHEREVLELSLDGIGREVAIRDADIVTVRPISPRFERAVTLRGNVANPGRFTWHEGMRLRDVIPDKESLVTRSYWAKKNSLAYQPVEDATKPRDPVGIGLGGTVPEINWSYAAIERQDREKVAALLIPFDLGKLVLENDATQNLELQAGDVVTIFSTSDMSVAQAQRNRYVRLEGEVKAAGIYLAGPGETLGQIIQRAGGLTSQAYLYGAEFTRESTRRDQQKRLDQFIGEMEKDLEETTRRSSLAANAETTQALAGQVQSARQTVARLRSLQATGRIVLNFDPNDATTAKLMTLKAEDGDRLMVPSRPATVNVFGEVYNQNAFLHEPQLRVADYLRESGGLKRGADKAHVFIIRADGSVLPKHGTGPFTKVFEAERLSPGDSIVVPESTLRVPFILGLRSWTQVLADLGLGAAAINVLK